jgi:hypothetical protein
MEPFETGFPRGTALGAAAHRAPVQRNAFSKCRDSGGEVRHVL